MGQMALFPGDSSAAILPRPFRQNAIHQTRAQPRLALTLSSILSPRTSLIQIFRLPFFA